MKNKTLSINGKHLIVLTISLLSYFNLSAQNKITYTYDNAGNRIERSVLATTRSLSTDDPFLQDQLIEPQFKIYPNPTKGQLKIEIENTEDFKNCTVYIYRFLDNALVLKKKADIPSTDVDISSQPLGIYILNINIDGKIHSWKILKN